MLSTAMWALFVFSVQFSKIWRETSRGFEPRSLDSESRVLTVTPRGRLHRQNLGRIAFLSRDFSRVRAVFSLSSWHLPKVLIFQSASARAGADRTLSDQYLGQLPGGEKEHIVREP